MIDTEKYFKQKLYGSEGKESIIDLTLNGIVKVRSRSHQFFFIEYYIFYFKI